jgi:hypothetical protein
MYVAKCLRMVTLVLLVTAAWPTQSGATRRRLMERALETLGNGDAGATTSLRLISLGSPHLVTSQSYQGRFTQSLAALVEGAGAVKAVSVAADSLPAIAALPGPAPDWDALAHADGSIAVVWTVAGSAVSHLSYKNRRDAVAVTVNRETPFGVFAGPHFVEGGRSDSIVAIASLSDEDPSVVVFRQQADGTFGKPIPIGVSWGGIPTCARLVQVSDGYLAFVKVLPPGGRIANAQPRRIFGAKLTQPGWLDVIRLNADLKPARTAATHLESDVVFELDAVSVGDRIALLTTTSTGGTLVFWDEQGHPIVEAGRSRSGSAQDRSGLRLTSAGPLTSPSLLFTEKHLYVAAIRDTEPGARLVGVKIDLTFL